MQNVPRHLIATLISTLVLLSSGCDDSTQSSTDTGSPADTTTPNSDANVIPDVGDTAVVQDTSTPPGDVAADAQVLPAFRTCVGLQNSVSTSGDWNHSITSAGKAVFDDGHSIEDLIFTYPNTQSGAVEGKFAYGVLSLDLEDELIFGFVDDCSGDWVPLGEATTNSDGRANFDLPASIWTQPGRYEVLMVVDGDATWARGYLLVVPAGTAFVVFDIDGTLTTDDGELFEQYFADLFGGTVVPEAYTDGQTLAHAYTDAGYEVLYITGRPYFLSKISRGWLVDEGFPVGNLHLTRTLGEAAPTEGGVGAYKRDYLSGVMRDHTIFRVYGNATTDIFAYGEAGMAKSDTFIIGANAGMDGTQAVTSYTDHLQQITISPAQQPFLR